MVLDWTVHFQKVFFEGVFIDVLIVVAEPIRSINPLEQKDNIHIQVSEKGTLLRKVLWRLCEGMMPFVCMQRGSANSTCLMLLLIDKLLIYTVLKDSCNVVVGSSDI